MAGDFLASSISNPQNLVTLDSRLVAVRQGEQLGEDDISSSANDQETFGLTQVQLKQTIRLKNGSNGRKPFDNY